MKRLQANAPPERPKPRKAIPRSSDESGDWIAKIVHDSEDDIIAGFNEMMEFLRQDGPAEVVKEIVTHRGADGNLKAEVRERSSTDPLWQDVARYLFHLIHVETEISVELRHRLEDRFARLEKEVATSEVGPVTHLLPAFLPSRGKTIEHDSN